MKTNAINTHRKQPAQVSSSDVCADWLDEVLDSTELAGGGLELEEQLLGGLYRGIVCIRRPFSS